MKNVLILGLLALLLFSVSATLSLWLNQPKTNEETGNKEKATTARTMGRDKAKPADEGPTGEPLTPVIRPKAHPAAEEVGLLSAQVREQLAGLKEREGHLDRRQAQLDVVLGDIRSERQSIDKLRKDVATELKLVGDKLVELERRAAELEQQRQAQPKPAADPQRKGSEPDEGERKNLERMASINDAMPPETAAKILQQMAEMGKLDTAARLLTQMKERQAAKVLAEFTDSALAVQLLEKMRTTKRPAPATPPANGQ